VRRESTISQARYKTDEKKMISRIEKEFDQLGEQNKKFVNAISRA